MNNSIDLRGEAALIKALRRLETKTGKTVLKKALRKAGNKIKNEVKKEAPEDTGNLKKSIKVFNDNSQASRGGALIRVGADRTIAPHAHLVEFGTDERYLDKPSVITLARGDVFTITQTGKMPANKFFDRGFQNSKVEAIQVFTDELKAEINKV